MGSFSEKFSQQLRQLMGQRFQENVPLAAFTTYKTGGPARFFVEPTSAEEVLKLLTLAASEKVPTFILGGGSNLLVSDEGLAGLVIWTRRLKGITREETEVTAQAGVRLASLLKFCLKEQLGGLEFLTGIPGTVGGAAVTNAGLKTSWFSSRVKTVTVLTPEKQTTVGREEICFGYRYSSLTSTFVFSVQLQLLAEKPSLIHSRMVAFMRKRREKQPPPFGTAGSVFKNPPGHFAGELIERCGLKGYSLGGAQISPKHANIIVNTGQASSSEIWRLIQLVRERVKQQYNICLELEINCLGRFDESCGSGRR